jgi:transposase
MRIEQLIDQELPVPHGNRQGLSYCQLAILLLSYIITQADRRLCAVESWVNQHHQTLEMDWLLMVLLGLKLGTV